jgi:hypothetical protein
MKNSTKVVLLLLILASSRMFAASHPERSVSNAVNTFYSEDFASGVPATWQLVDNAGNGVNWHYTITGIFHFTGDANDSLNSVGTSAANGYMIYDSDSANPGVGGENADMISEVIDCSTNANVHLKFNQLLKHFAESATVSVSTDGLLWTMVYDASAGLAQNAATPNPDVVDVDISTLAANQATVYLKFNFTGDFDYWWMIDDVQLYENVGVDAALSSVTAPVTTCNLLTAAEAITVSIYNNGGGPLSNFDVTYIVDGGTPVTEPVALSIAVGTSGTYTFTATADLSAPGNHTIQTYVTAAGDTSAGNDTAMANIYNGPHVVNTSTNYSTGFELTDDLSGWMIEDTNNDLVSWDLSDVLPHTGLYCARMSGVVASDWIYTTCLDLSDTIQYEMTYFYKNGSTVSDQNFKISIGMAQDSASMTQDILPINLVTNLSYLPGMDQFTVPVAGTYYIGFYVGTGTQSNVSFRLDDINLYDASGVNILKHSSKKSLQLFPNPTTGLFRINNVEEGQVEVISPLGQIIYSQKINSSSNEVNLNDQPAGIYSVRIITKSGVSASQVVISR